MTYLPSRSRGLRRFGRRGDLSLGQPGEFVSGIHHHRRGVHLVQGVLAEGRREGSEFAVDLPHPLFLGLGEQGAGAGEVAPVLLHEAHFFGREVQIVPGLVERLYLGEQVGVQQDLVRVCRQLRRHLRADGVDFVVRVGGGEAEEDPRHPVEEPARALHRHQGVLECGRLRGPRDGLNLFELLGHPALERRAVVAVLDEVEGGEAVGEGAFGKEGVVAHFGLRCPAAAGGQDQREDGGRSRGRKGPAGHISCSCRSEAARCVAATGDLPKVRARCQRQDSSLSFPRVDNADPAVPKVPGVPRRDSRAAGCDDGRDLGVGDGDVASGASPSRHDVGETLCGFAVEGEDSVAHETTKDLVRRAAQFLTPRARRQPGHPVAHFRLRYGGREQCVRRLETRPPGNL